MNTSRRAGIDQLCADLSGQFPAQRVAYVSMLLLFERREASEFALALYELEPADAELLAAVLRSRHVAGVWRRRALEAKLASLEAKPGNGKREAGNGAEQE